VNAYDSDQIVYQLTRIADALEAHTTPTQDEGRPGYLPAGENVTITSEQGHQWLGYVYEVSNVESKGAYEKYYATIQFIRKVK